MKLCKKILAAVIAAAMLALCIPALAITEPDYPEAPEGYDGYVTFAVSAVIMGWTYLVDPMLVPVNEGETVAQVTERAFEMLDLPYTYNGTVEEGFYLTGIACYDTEPDVPEYLMNEILAYPAWAEENFGYSFGEWTGTYDDDDMLSASEYCTMSGWMYTEDNISASDGADAHVIQVGSVYTWLFSVYGWGMDYGISDGWGSFPLFDNPMEGVDRTRLSRVLALISADDELTELVFDNAVDEFMAAVEALYSVYSTQDEIDACIEALLAALDGGEYLPGDADMDGEITSADALIIMRCAMGVAELSAQQAALADFDGDGDVDMTDALLLMRSVM